MNLTRDRLRSIGRAFGLTVCAALTLALTFRVNAVKSQVHLAEREIIELKQAKLHLETEFLARGSQEHLRTINELEFGYEAPRSKQYIEGERQLAAFGKARGPGAPAPIRVANAPDGTERSVFPAMVSPLTGTPFVREDAMARDSRGPGGRASGLGNQITRFTLREAATE